MSYPETTMPLDVRQFNEPLLRKLHSAVVEALREDDQLPEGRKKYGAREFRDWKQVADLLESEMAQRGVDFSPIIW